MDEAIISIRKYLEELSDDNYYGVYFAKHSYMRWATEEILNGILEESERLPAYLTGRPVVTASDIALELLSRLNYCICVEGADKKDSMFHAAKEAAEEIIKMVE